MIPADSVSRQWNFQFASSITLLIYHCSAGTTWVTG